MEQTDYKKFFGRRVLVENLSNHSALEEHRFCEMSESGSYVKIEYPGGGSKWLKIIDYLKSFKLLEVLPEIKEKPQTVKRPKRESKFVEKEKLFSHEEAAEYLGLAPITLWRARKAGKLPFRRITNKIYYSPDDLQIWLKKQEQPTI